MTADAEADLAQQAADATKPTTTRKARTKPDSPADAITILQREVQALATLVHSMKDDAPDGTIRGSKINNLSARLEKLEQQVQGENGLLSAVQQVETSAGRHDVDPAEVEELRTAVTSVRNQLSHLKAAFEGYSVPASVETVMSEIQQLRDHVDAASKMQPGLDTVSSSLRESLADYIDTKVATLSPLVQNLSNQLSGQLDRHAERLFAVETATAKLIEHGSPAQSKDAGAVYGKVLALMDEVDHIAKGRIASGGGVNYKFRGIEDAQNAVGAAMRKVRVLLRPEVVSWDYGQVEVETTNNKGELKRTMWATSRLTMRYVFVAPEDGSTFVIEMVGEGKDNSDKSASKAASMACKYALFQALMIPFESVDESDAQNDAIAESTYQRGRQETRDERAAEQVKAAPVVLSTPEEKAAALVRWVKDVQGRPAAEALQHLQKAKDRAAEHGLEDVMVEEVPVKLHISTALQIVNTAVQQSAARTGSSQGMSRQAQQSGEGARAAAVDPDMAADLIAETTMPSEREYEEALAALRGERGDLDDDAVTRAERIVREFEGGRA